MPLQGACGGDGPAPQMAGWRRPPPPRTRERESKRAPPTPGRLACLHGRWSTAKLGLTRAAGNASLRTPAIVRRASETDRWLKPHTTQFVVFVSMQAAGRGAPRRSRRRCAAPGWSLRSARLGGDRGVTSTRPPPPHTPHTPPYLSRVILHTKQTGARESGLAARGNARRRGWAERGRRRRASRWRCGWAGPARLASNAPTKLFSGIRKLPDFLRQSLYLALY